jgi:hypothetical protein
MEDNLGKRVTSDVTTLRQKQRPAIDHLRCNRHSKTATTYEPDSTMSPTSAMLGDKVLGPLCYGFVHWLVREARAAGVEHLFFLSRDGWLLKKAFDLLPRQVTDGLTSHYLYSSRRAVWFASLKEDTSESEFNEILSGASPYLPVKVFLRRIFIEPEECIEEIRAAGFSDEHDLITTASDRLKLYDLFKSIKPKIVARAEEERASYLAYLEHAGLMDNRKAGLVDVGWTGSVVKYTRALVQSVDESIELNGYFIGVGSKAKSKYGFEKGDCLRGYLFEFDDDAHPELLECLFIIEKFLSPNEPSLMKMVRHKNGFKPVYKQGQRETTPFNSIVQKHALQFVKDQSRSGVVEKIDEALFLPLLKKTLTDPDVDVARLLSQYAYSTDFGYQIGAKPIAATQENTAYWRNPIQLLKDFRRARWKAGFIAQQSLPARIVLKTVKRTRLDRWFNSLLLLSKKLR